MADYGDYSRRLDQLDAEATPETTAAVVIARAAIAECERLRDELAGYRLADALPPEPVDSDRLSPTSANGATP